MNTIGTEHRMRTARALSKGVAGFLAMCVTLGSCVPVWSPSVSPPTSAAVAQTMPASSKEPKAPSLKLHLHSGELIIATVWLEDTTARTLRVSGTLYDANRRSLGPVQRAVPMDSIALVQASTPGNAYPGGLVMLAIWGTGATIVSGSCLADPKSCFGSCPTFYAQGDTSFIQAEGFSASPLRALEARDMDHLYFAASPPGPFVLRMRNEALETHALRSVRLLIAPQPINGRIFHSPSDDLYPAYDLTAPTRCQSAKGDCAASVASLDRDEWQSVTDSTDLAAQEVVELTFDRTEFAPHGRFDETAHVGLVLGARHTLVSTFLFYQALAFAGGDAGEALARLERGPVAAQPPLFAALRSLGSIGISVSADGVNWNAAGHLLEAGPLATDPQIVPLTLPAGTGPVRIRLSLTKGYWRLNYAALARLGARVEPMVLLPVSVKSEGRTVAGASAAAALADPTRVLVTGPGDDYALTFALPASLPLPSGRWEVFLESTGWYYEWMRDEWIAEQDAARATQLLYSPRDAFRALAPVFKSREATNERAFWQSRITRGRP
ncbi:MAG: hypothetical protein IPP90_04525 [Gemmatimonadaceae bacterium]|nr:hypothetical protein [Gemmatimonadaceae bacterium]